LLFIQWHWSALWDVDEAQADDLDLGPMCPEGHRAAWDEWLAEFAQRRGHSERVAKDTFLE